MKAIYLVVVILLFGYIVIGVTVTELKSSEKNSVYNYLKDAKANPDNYLVVAGTSAKSFEKEAARDIAESLGTRFVTEEDVPSNHRLIFIGNKYTNVLLDKYTSKKADPAKLNLYTESKNLFIIINSKEQAEKAASMVSDIDANKLSLSSDFVVASPTSSLIAIIVISLIILPFVLLGFELIRNMMLKSEHVKLLRKYIKIYTEKGYTQEELIDWLKSNGYDISLADIKKEEKDDRAVIPG